MAGAISSLGLGSGVLTSDILDQLREVDESGQITPIETKIETENQKTEALGLLDSLLTSFGGAVGDLASELSYAKRSTSVTGSGSSDISVTASSGVLPQSFELEVLTMATEQINELGDSSGSKFTSDSQVIGTGAGTLSLTVGGAQYDIAYDATTTLTDLKDAINDAAGDQVTASILQVADGEYSLVIKGDDTGTTNAISYTDNDGNLDIDFTSAAIQDAGDASFKYNGITMSRSSNTIDDIIVGVEINLLDTGSGTSDVTISQDTSDIITNIESFVDSYNSLMNKFNDLTQADVENNTVGLFNGDSTLNSMRREITKILTSSNSFGSLVGLEYGTGKYTSYEKDDETDPDVGTGTQVYSSISNIFQINRSGVMTFDSSAFESKLAEDPDLIQNIFVGGTNSQGDEEEGIFTKLENLVDGFNESDGKFTLLKNNILDNTDNLWDEYDKTMALLDTKYETMSNIFVQYDTMINKLNTQFNSLNMMIQAATSSDS